MFDIRVLLSRIDGKDVSMNKKRFTDYSLYYLAFCLFTFSSLETLGRDFYIDATNGNNVSGDGTKENPWKHITVAFKQNENSPKAGDIIHLAPGIYSNKPDEYGFYEEIIDLSEGVSIIGESSETAIIEDSIIRVGGGKNVLISGLMIRSSNNDDGIMRSTGISIYENAEVIIDSCYITHKNPGIYIHSASTTIKNSTITNNERGILNNEGNVTILNNSISNNIRYVLGKINFTAGSKKIYGGAGIWNDGKAYISGNLFYGNTIIYEDKNFSQGAGIFNNGEALIYANVFENNSAEMCGGGIWSYSVSENVEINNNVFKKNNAGETGGAVYDEGNNTNIVNNLFVENKAKIGNAISAKMANIIFCTFYNNNSGDGTIHDEGGNGDLKIKYCIIAHSSGYGIIARYDTEINIISNNVFWGNQLGIFNNKTHAFNYSDALNIMVEGAEGNLSIDPGFIDVEGNNFDLLSTSPCIDAVPNTLPGIEISTIDILGRMRPHGNGYDIGAFEYGGIVPTPTPTPLPIPHNTKTPGPIPVITPIPNLEPIKKYKIDAETEFTRLSGGFIEPPAQGGDVFIGEIPREDSDRTDGHGAMIITSPGELELLMFPTIEVGDNVVLIRVFVHSSGGDATIALACLDGSMDGSIATNIPANSHIFQDRYHRMFVLFDPPGNSVTPVFQVSNLNGDQTLVVYMDNLEIYSLPKGVGIPSNIIED